MALRELFKSYRINSFTLIITMVLTSFFIIGGCNNNNNNSGEGEFGGTPPAAPMTMSQCTNLNAQGQPFNPCQFVTTESDGSYTTCRLYSNVCVVDLSDVITQVGNGVSDSTIMWIEAWGGNGGDNDGGSDGGAGGYAVTTTTVSDLSMKNSGSTVFHYFAGAQGQQGGDHCGSPGGAATLFTTEDLTLNPGSNPTQSAPPFILIAGGGGGGCGGNTTFGCVRGGCTQDGGAGGVAIGVEEEVKTGAGDSLTVANEGNCEEQGPTACGGNQDGMGGGGQRFFDVPGSDSSTSGTSGYGGLGGHGGSGQKCTHDVNNQGFISAQLVFTAGQGGVGGSATSMCDSGGAGGGGGYGGAGGGGHGNDLVSAIAGGGGGSLVIQSTKFTESAPTTMQTNPCGVNGCVTISFELP